MNLLLCLLFFGTPPTLLEKAIKANGPWEQVHTFYYKQDFAGYNPWQSYSFTLPPPAIPELAEYYMDVDKGKYHSHTISQYPGGYVFDLITIGKDSTRFFYDKTYFRYGKTVTQQGKESYINYKDLAQAALPYFILQELAGSKDSLKISGTTIQRIRKDSTIQEYIIDTATNLLESVESNNEKRVFEKYQEQNGLLVPTVISTYIDKKFFSTETLASFKINITIPPVVFEIPPQYRLSTEIAKDVFIIEKLGGDRNVIFINMQDYIVVTEAPQSTALSKSIIDIIHKTIPGKPIKYVHLSHHHNDHIDGVNAFVAEGATILCADSIEIAVRSITKGKIETFHTKKVIEDATHRIELLQVPNTHAEGMSILYLPKEGIIFEGDLLSLPLDGTLSPANTTGKEFYQYLLEHKIVYERIIGYHNNSNITPAQFQHMLKLR